MELNLESDLTPLDAQPQRATVHIPAAFFVDPRLGTGTVTVNRVDYEQALVATGSPVSRNCAAGCRSRLADPGQGNVGYHRRPNAR